MTELGFAEELRALFGPEAANAAKAIYGAVLGGSKIVARHIDPITAAAFLTGALATLARARLALFGAGLLLGGECALALGLIPAVPEWLAPLALALLAAGFVQGCLTLVVGEQTAGAVLTAAAVGVPLFLLWRGPARLVCGVGLLASRTRIR